MIEAVNRDTDSITSGGSSDCSGIVLSALVDGDLVGISEDIDDTLR